MPIVTRDRRLLAAAAAAAALALAGCGGPGSSGSSPTTGEASRSPAIASVPVGSGATGGATPAPATAGGGSPGSSAPAVPIDPALLEVLPPTVAGLPITPSSDPAGADDPGLIDTVDRMAQAIVVDPATDGFAFISVIAPQPGVFDEAFYRSWRDTFDDGACSQAGGVGGHAEAQIGGRTTYIGHCTGGVTTYHVRLEDRDLIVSVSSLGETRLGEQVLAALRP